MSDTPRYWKRLTQLQPHEMRTRPEVIRETARHYGIDEAEARVLLDREAGKCLYFINDLYQIEIGRCGRGGKVMHINIRRRDGAAIFDWRHMQQIKNELAGEEACAYQKFPPESQKVDTSNKYHLFVPPPDDLQSLETIGWNERDVQYVENKDVPGLRQRTL